MLARERPPGCGRRSPSEGMAGRKRTMRWFGRRRASGAAPTADAAPTTLIEGRMRVAGVPYMLPRDMEEISRLDFQHYILRHAFQGIYAPPIGEPSAILDVGTGTGRWA